MSSSTTSFARALSPSLEGITQAIISQTLAGESKKEDLEFIGEEFIAVIHAKIAECRSIDQVIDCVYPDYRLAFREHLLSYTSWCEKKETVSTSYDRLKRALESQTIPPRLKVKAPEFQFTKEFGDSTSDAASAARNAFANATATFQEAISKASLDGKKAELEFWTDKVDVNYLVETLGGVIADTWNDRKNSFGVPTINYDEQGKPHLGNWVVSPQKKAERDTLIRAIALLGSQINQIVAIRHRALASKIEKKREVAATADVEMADATRPGPSIQSLIDKGLNARLKKLNLVPSGKAVSRSYPHTTYLANDCSNYSELVWPRQKETGPQSQQCIFIGAQIERQGQESVSTELQKEGEYTDRQEEAGQGKAKRREERSKRERKSLDARLTEISVSPAYPHTIPDEILNYTWDHAVTYVHLHTPIDYLEAGRFRNSVHCSDGVVIPPEISNELSLGLKYMFFTPPSKKLIMQAWSEFQQRLRWRIFFLFKEGMNKPYDPDYSVKHHSNMEPPKLPQWMEFGLVMGRRYVFSTIASIPDEKLMEIKKNPFSPHSYKILRFLKDNNYIVTMTDKNLGLAVSERDWLISNELKLLNDIRNYKELNKEDADLIMKSKGSKMIELSDMVDEHLFLSELKLNDYFKSKVARAGEEIIYPQFHGLPKIHKKPTGFRPIIPCHSVCFNPAAKFVSKELKPLVKAAPSIIHGTKDLFTRLSQLRIEPRRKFFFVTGDVVAFYPNVPLISCIDIVTAMYEDWLFRHSTVAVHPLVEPNSLENNLVKLKIFKRAIEIGNTQLITQHGDKFFEQLNGLAMGVADSPDLASLYGYHFEERSKILDHPQVAFYGRYIDDCIGIIYAESADEALNLLSNTVKFDGCVIEWAVSDSQCQFLDATIFQKNNRLGWKPYVKVGNNRERIPWVSHHPMDVKRGVYIGELSRIAVICSNKDIYIEAIKDLNALYQARGYPVPLISSWCRKNIQERWEKRFALRSADSTDDKGVLVLKTRFDDVWNWFSAIELGETITKYWEEWYERADQGRYHMDPSRPFPAPDSSYEHGITDVRPDLFARVKDDVGEEMFVPDLRKIGLLGSRWVVSRKRNTNLFDLANVWKKVVFRQLDEHIATEGGVVPEIPRDDPLTLMLETDKSLAQALEVESDDEILLHRREHSQELEHPEFGRASKSYAR